MTTTLTPLRTFLSDKGKWFAVRVLPPGARYGAHGTVVDRALVEFYDANHADDRQPGDLGGFGPLGQFIGQHYLATLLGRGRYGHGTGGLCLYGGEPAWDIDEPAMDEIRAWLRPLAADYGEDKPMPPPSLGRPAAH